MRLFIHIPTKTLAVAYERSKVTDEEFKQRGFEFLTYLSTNVETIIARTQKDGWKNVLVWEWGGSTDHISKFRAKYPLTTEYKLKHAEKRADDLEARLSIIEEDLYADNKTA